MKKQIQYSIHFHSPDSFSSTDSCHTRRAFHFICSAAVKVVNEIITSCRCFPLKAYKDHRLRPLSHWKPFGLKQNCRKFVFYSWSFNRVQKSCKAGGTGSNQRMKTAAEYDSVVVLMELKLWTWTLIDVSRQQVSMGEEFM